MAKLILMRHGASAWNELNLFTGWVDVPLSKKGVREAIDGGQKIKSLPIDVIYTSKLIRAQMTAFLAMNEHEAGKVPVLIPEEVDPYQENLQGIIPTYAAWQLNERMYGELQGLNKDVARERFGKEQVHIWRRSFDVPPPGGESLEMTAKRTLPYFESEIKKSLDKGLNVFVSAHGNSLRSIIMDIHQISKKDIINLEIATGEPMIYDYINGKFQRLEE